MSSFRNLKSTPSLLLIASVSLIVSGCNSSGGSAAASSNSSTSGGGGSSGLTEAILASGSGTYGYSETCIPITDTSYGTAFNTGHYSVSKNIMYGNGTYSLSAAFFYGTTQACAYSSSVSEIGVYSQGGTYTIGSAVSSPSGGYTIAYVATSASFTLYGGTSGGGSPTPTGNQWVTDFNNDCAIAPFTSGSASTNNSISGVTCTDVDGVGLSFPPLGDFYDVLVPSSLTSPSSISVHQGISVFYMGEFSSYPTTATLSLTN